MELPQKQFPIVVSVFNSNLGFSLVLVEVAVSSLSSIYRPNNPQNANLITPSD